jgi:hypothetical protein
MSNKKITDLPELTNPTTDDVFPIVDIATNTTQKVQVGNLPIQTAVTTALATKQATLVSGTNIKTVNGTSVLGSGDINIPLTPPSGVSGAIQFSTGSAFASDATNLFWDDTNNRLGVGTNTPLSGLQVSTNVLASSAGYSSLGHQTGEYGGVGSNYYNPVGGNYFRTNADPVSQMYFDAGGFVFRNSPSAAANSGIVFTTRALLNSTGDLTIGNGGTTLGARVGIKGSGSTSATTSLLVQNSSAVTMAQIKDNGEAYFNIDRTGNGFQIADGGAPTQQTVLYQKGGITQTTTRGSSSLKYFIWSSNGSEFPNGHFGYNFDQFIISDVQKDLDAAKIASAVLQADSTTRGFLPPRMTTTQKNAIATPAAGLVVYDSTTNKLCCYNGSTWNDLF